jgi:hypothetical protein
VRENFYLDILNKKQPGSLSVVGEDYITPTPVAAPVNTTNDNFVVTGSKPLLDPVVSQNFLAQTAAPNPDLATPARTALLTEMATPAQSQVVKPATPPEFPSPAKTPYEQYWGQNVGTSKAGLPLDQFVKIAGLAAKYFDPQNPIANDLIKMGGEAYNERARREYEGPNVLLQRQMHQAQLDKLKAESGLLPQWETYKKGRLAAGETNLAKIVEDYNTMLSEHKEKSKTFERIIPNPNFDKDKPVSFDNPRQIKESLIYSGGKTVQDPDIPPVPVLDEFTKSETAKYNKEQELSIAKARLGLAGETLAQAKKKAAESKSGWFAFGTDPATNKILFVNKNGETKLGDLPPGVKSIAPKVENPLTPAQQMLKDALEKRKAKAKTGGTQPAAGGESAQYPEGTVIKNKAGKRKIMRNGQFVDFIQGEQ